MMNSNATDLEALRRAAAVAGYELSTWAATVRWGDDETNTAEWLGGLGERIGLCQQAYREATQ